jgi:hypothetical protein
MCGQGFALLLQQQSNQIRIGAKFAASVLGVLAVDD